MDKRIVQEQFFQKFGYRGDEDELADYMAAEGYRFFDDDYADYSKYRYGSVRRDCSDDNDASGVGSIGAEFSKLMKEILEQAKKHKDNEAEAEQLMIEFGYMALLFLLKTSLYFVLRYCEGKGYCYGL